MALIGNVSHREGTTNLEDFEEDYFPPKFKEYLLKESLKWSRLHLRGLSFGWVFWSHQDHEIEPSLPLDNCAEFNPDVCAIPKVRDNIRHALQEMMLLPELHELPNFLENTLFQFWAATKTLEGRTLLTTQYQPFALGITHNKTDRQRLCEYRMRMCKEYNCFYADAESGEEQLGLPGRVFLHQFPESSPDVKYYSSKEYPQRDLALHCEINKSWAVPVFEHSSQTCVGVLEIVCQDYGTVQWFDKSFLNDMYDIFQCRDDNIGAHTIAFLELNMVLRLVCEVHELLLAMPWVPCTACNDLRQGQFMSEVLEYVEQEDSKKVFAFTQFLKVSKISHLRKGWVYEKALSSPYMLYCSDITQLSIPEYPLVHYARRCNFSGWFAICLQSSYTEKEVYVVEFFLPTSNKDDKNILTTLSLILGTMEENFKTFKLASGQQLGEILLVEVMDFRNGQILHSVKRIQAPEKDRGLMLQLGRQDQPSTDAIHSEMNVVSEEENYILPSLEALHNGEATMQLDSPYQPPLDSSNNGHNAVTTEENIIVVTSFEEGKRKTRREHKGTGVKIPVSLDDICKCAGMKRKGAAKKLKVSVSTFKRACREHGIDRWPPRNMETVSLFRPSPVENQAQTLELDSDLPSNQAVLGVAHEKPGVQDANRVTIRAKYKNKTIKFHLSSSSRLVEFQQEVAKRLPLEAGTYYAEYKDGEGELIFIACDDDLQECLHTPRSQGNPSIEVLLKLEEPLINLNPAN